MPDADQNLADVGHLREVALPDRADLPDDRVDVPVQDVDEKLRQLAPHADAGLGHAVDTGHHHRPHDVTRQGPAVGGAQVRHGVEGEAPELLGRDPVTGKGAEARVEAVNRLTAREHRVDDIASLLASS